MAEITVVIPTFNRAGLVPLAIRSVLAQTHPAAEIIVVDDGSADRTSEVLAEFGPKIRAIRQQNGGLSAARNTGINAARTEWIAFLDDDDEYAADRLARAAESIARNPHADAHLTNTAIVADGAPDLDLFALRGVPSGPWQAVERPLGWVLKGCFFAQSLVVRRRVLHELGLFRKTFYEDMDLFVRLVPHRPWIIDNQPTLRLIRRGNTQAMSDDWRSKPIERCGALARIHRECLALPELNAGEIWMVRSGLAAYLFELGAALALKGETRTARRHFAESMRTSVAWRPRAKALAAFVAGRPFVRLVQRMAQRQKRFVR